MKVQEYMKLHNLNTDEDLRLHFLNNLQQGKLPVAFYSCPNCLEIMGNTTDLHVCTTQNEKENTMPAIETNIDIAEMSRVLQESKDIIKDFMKFYANEAHFLLPTELEKRMIDFLKQL